MKHCASSEESVTPYLSDDGPGAKPGTVLAIRPHTCCVFALLSEKSDPVQRQTAVTADLESQQLLLFVFVGQCGCLDIDR